MKATTIALLWMAAAATVFAQAAPPSQRIVSDTRTALVKPAATQAQAAPSAARPEVPRAGQADAAMRRKLARPPVIRRPAVQTAAKPAGAAVQKAAIKTTSVARPLAKRDPFVSPIREQSISGPNCSTGKKCLAINAMVLRGIVRSQAGMIAVVESSTRRISYFLRENDPVFNGYVVRITADSVVFRENVMDRLGKQSTRDVVMKVVAPVV